MLFMRVFVDMYPEREAELVARIAEGRFDIGGTFTEGLESTQLNELMARQMYTGRKVRRATTLALSPQAMTCLSLRSMQ